MSEYIQLLEFFLKNKIKLNKKQVDNLKDKSKKKVIKDQKYTLEKADSPTQFNSLYNKEAFTLEGLKNSSSKDTAQMFANYFRDKWKIPDNITIKFYWCEGRDLNGYYCLSGSNKYPDSLGIFIIDWSNFPKNIPISTIKQTCGFRYFSDVVDNNARREIQSKNPDYIDGPWANYHSLYGDKWFYSTI